MSEKLDKAIAVPVVALDELGKTQVEISEELGVSQHIVSDILNSKGRWSRIKNELWFQNYKDDCVRKLRTLSFEIQKAALRRMAETIDTTSASQAGVVYGILTEKNRLLGDESTQNIATRSTKEEGDKLTRALDKLVNTLKADDGPKRAT